jgi:hypothetical protein
MRHPAVLGTYEMQSVSPQRTRRDFVGFFWMHHIAYRLLAAECLSFQAIMGTSEKNFSFLCDLCALCGKSVAGSERIQGLGRFPLA